MIQVEKVKISNHIDSLSVSRLSYGIWMWHEVSREHSNALLRTCIQHGITTIDCADIYGGYQCEAIAGEVLSHNIDIPRESLQIVSKTGICLVNGRRPSHEIKFYNTSKEHIINSAKNSVDLLKSQYLDLFLIHRPDPLMNPHEIAEAFHYLKSSGIVKHFGVSNFTPSQFSLISSGLPADMPLVTNQVQLSPAYSHLLFDGTFDQAIEKGVKPMTYSPLRGIFKPKGEIPSKLLSVMQNISDSLGVSADKVALSWSLKHPSNPIPILGTLTPERITLGAEATNVILDRQQWFKILEAGVGKEVA